MPEVDKEIGNPLRPNAVGPILTTLYKVDTSNEEVTVRASMGSASDDGPSFSRMRGALVETLAEVLADALAWYTHTRASRVCARDDCESVCRGPVCKRLDGTAQIDAA